MNENIKKYLIGGVIGFVLAGILGIGYWKYNPKIIITQETPTTTTITNIPPDYDHCIKCVESEGKISESIDIKNVMTITYEDMCKKAEKQVTLKAVGQRKHFLIFEISNSIYSDSFITYGGNLSYYYMLWDRLGIGGGTLINQKSANFHAGLVWSW